MKTSERTMEKIYMDFGGKVLRYVRSKISDPQDAEDVCASVFLKVQRGLSAYDDSRSSLSTWIYSIAHNAVICTGKSVPARKRCYYFALLFGQISERDCRFNEYVLFKHEAIAQKGAFAPEKTDAV